MSLTHFTNFMSFYESGQFADVILECSDGEIRCHSIVLAHQSEYFRAAITKAEPEKILDCTDFKKDCLDLLVRICYDRSNMMQFFPLLSWWDPFVEGLCAERNHAISVIFAADMLLLHSIRDQLLELLIESRYTFEDAIQLLGLELWLPLPSLIGENLEYECHAKFPSAMDLFDRDMLIGSDVPIRVTGLFDVEGPKNLQLTTRDPYAIDAYAKLFTQYSNDRQILKFSDDLDGKTILSPENKELYISFDGPAKKYGRANYPQLTWQHQEDRGIAPCSGEFAYVVQDDTLYAFSTGQCDSTGLLRFSVHLPTQSVETFQETYDLIDFYEVSELDQTTAWYIDHKGKAIYAFVQGVTDHGRLFRSSFKPNTVQGPYEEIDGKWPYTAVIYADPATGAPVLAGHAFTQYGGIFRWDIPINADVPATRAGLIRQRLARNDAIAAAPHIYLLLRVNRARTNKTPHGILGEINGHAFAAKQAITDSFDPDARHCPWGFEPSSARLAIVFSHHLIEYDCINQRFLQCRPSSYDEIYPRYSSIPVETHPISNGKSLVQCLRPDAFA